MNTYEIRFADGSTAHIADNDPLNACQRAADLYPDEPVIAWRYDRRPQIRIGIPTGA